MTYYEANRIRAGKTAKDREKGAFARNTANKAKRTTWVQNSNSTNATFPRETCNGKRNRYLK
jgi:hypothetical protein